MKNFIIVLALALVSFNARTNYKSDKNAPIVDYNQSYEYYEQSRNLNEATKRYNEQTVYLFNGKEITYKKFKQLFEKEKIKSIENILDKEKITHLGYSYDKVKRIIFTSSLK